jgi:dCMP deaminase
MERLSKDEYFTNMAQLVSRRATCARRSVGCVLVSSRGHVLATGYNGPPSGSNHCSDTPCPGASYPSGSGLERCEAVHAEQNALLQCRDVFQIETAYVTTMPCMTCTKLLLNTSCKRIVFLQDYPQQEAKELWTRNGRELIQATI